jgi:beta-lactamase superfamily II metal-dependent hydrolase
MRLCLLLQAAIRFSLTAARMVTAAGSRLLWIGRVSHIDFFLATHYHEDHYGGIDDLVGLGIPVLESFDRGDKAFIPADKQKEDTFTDYQSAVGEDATPLRRGMAIALDLSMTVTCISSGGVVVNEANPTTGVDENDMSVSLLITFGGFRYFVGGDIEGATEAKIAARDLVRDVDVYQADHHGSAPVLPWIS